MKAYLDASALVAWFYPKDHLTAAVFRWHMRTGAQLVFNDVLRIEVRHHLRKIANASWRVAAWRAYRAAEKASILKQQQIAWAQVLDKADGLSETYAHNSRVGAWDVSST